MHVDYTSPTVIGLCLKMTAAVLCVIKCICKLLSIKDLLSGYFCCLFFIVPLSLLSNSLSQLSHCFFFHHLSSSYLQIQSRYCVYSPHVLSCVLYHIFVHFCQSAGSLSESSSSQRLIDKSLFASDRGHIKSNHCTNRLKKPSSVYAQPLFRLFSNHKQNHCERWD